MITIDLTRIIERLAALSGKIDFDALFFTVFIALACFSVANLSLKLLADKKIKFSLPMLTLFVLSGGALFGIAYLEYENYGVIFNEFYRVPIYACSEFVAITVLYAVFLGFAFKNERAGEQKNAETAACVFNKKRFFYKEPRRVYSVVISKRREKTRGDFSVDFGGAHDFLSGIDPDSPTFSEATKLKNKIGFYDGLSINDGNLRTINELFSQAVRLAGKDK